ncbi:hypothetical protein BKA62DRAFT_833710 [Auriculariales sp. MPI-PUGE-AT-0066]|nr:hypothetical protein BKA62DRAFT_833710 [Auriculariales sp. MPI-PUGE-AT-0066]
MAVDNIALATYDAQTNAYAQTIADVKVDQDLQQLLDVKVDQNTGVTAETVAGEANKQIAPFKCFFCGQHSQINRYEKAGSNNPNRHRTGLWGWQRCRVFQALGGFDNMFRVVSFLLVRWPELQSNDWRDDQLNGNLRKAVKEYLKSGSPSANAKLAVQAYARDRKSPAPGSGYCDRELGFGEAGGDAPMDVYVA